MHEYLRHNPLVALAVLATVGIVATMLARSVVLLLFLRSLRVASPEVWGKRLRGFRLGVARVAGLRPRDVAMADMTPCVQALCTRYAVPLRYLALASGLWFGLAAGLLIGSTLRWH